MLVNQVDYLQMALLSYLPYIGSMSYYSSSRISMNVVIIPPLSTWNADSNRHIFRYKYNSIYIYILNIPEVYVKIR